MTSHEGATAIFLSEHSLKKKIDYNPLLSSVSTEISISVVIFWVGVTASQYKQGKKKDTI